MDSRQQAYLKAMGIDVWARRESLTEADMLIPAVRDGMPVSVPADGPSVANSEDFSLLDWAALQAKVSTCTLCGLQQGRTQTVFGDGHQQAELLIIGEAPGPDEDRQGEPFVGQSGQLLTAMLKAIQLSRQDVYVTNVLKCRVPDGRAPGADEHRLCSQYLRRQIELLQPKLILALGQSAAQALLQTDNNLSQLRGQSHLYALTNTPLIVSYHPAGLLQTPADKGRAWQDLLFVQRTLGDRRKAD